MAKARIFAAAGALVLIGTAATGAQAQSKPRPADALTVRGDFNPQTAAQPQTKIIQWDTKKGRWGLKLDLGRNDTQWKDVEAGAYFRVTPSLRVGGAVGLESTQDAPVRKQGAEEAAPKVRLETAFKF